VIGDSRVSSARTRVRRASLASSGGALLLLLFNASPVWGSQRVAVSTTGNATGGGALLLGLGAGVLILGGGGFTVLMWSRRKRAPQPCATEREALEMAEQAVRYWEGALMHLRNAARSQDGGARGDTSDDGATRESNASLLEKAKSGHASALKVRDERQLELIRCMASTGGSTPAGKTKVETLQPIRFDADLPSTPPTPLT
jgi:hypothetical protein